MPRATPPHIRALAPLAPLLLLLSETLRPTAAGVFVEEAGLRIVFPPNREKRMDFAMADFGEARYGGAMMGDLYYPTSDPDSLPVGQKTLKCFPEDCQYACQPFEDAKPAALVLPKKPGRLNIMLVDRGPADSTSCFYLTKAWNAQRAGAHAMIIVDYRDDSLATATVPEDPNINKVLLNVTIAVGIVSKSDGQSLKDLLKYEPVTVSLNWTNVEPRSMVVQWELFTNSNDECGTICDEQRLFVNEMGEVAKELEKQGLTEFSPHYLLWSCPEEYLQSEACTSQCVQSGTYCAPDPDGDNKKGYSGLDVLTMNARQLCFYRMAKDAGKPWLWWDLSSAIGESCRMVDRHFTEECALQVFDKVGGPASGNNLNVDAWTACYTSLMAESNNDIFEQERKVQDATEDEPGVSILPTVRINGQQYRGTMDVRGVTRALCAAFPTGGEPSMCNDRSVSENECQAGSVGDINCRVAESNSNTRCINTFAGYSCECGAGWVTGQEPTTGEATCEDLNECLATNIPLTDPTCSCDRCACINTRGAYWCTGPLPNLCSNEYNWNGCWSDPSARWLHPRSVAPVAPSACVDNIEAYKAAVAQYGEHVNINFSYCSCTPSGSCYEGDGIGKEGCRINCDMASCVRDPDSRYHCADHVPHSQDGSMHNKRKGGFASFMLVLVSVAAFVGLVLTAYTVAVKRGLVPNVHSLMERATTTKYMPLTPMADTSLPFHAPTATDYHPPAPVFSAAVAEDELVDDVLGTELLDRRSEDP